MRKKMWSSLQTRKKEHGREDLDMRGRHVRRGRRGAFACVDRCEVEDPRSSREGRSHSPVSQAVAEVTRRMTLVDAKQDDNHDSPISRLGINVSILSDQAGGSRPERMFMSV
jgi:hypothetical protein